MKILAVYECQISGGTDRLLIHLIKNWPDQKANWTVLCHSKNSGVTLLKDELQGYAEIKTYSVGNKKGNVPNSFGVSKWKVTKIFNKSLFLLTCFKQLLFFRHILKKDRPDLVYLHQGGYPGGFSEHMAGIAAKTLKPKIKVVVSIQNLPAMRDKKLFSKVMDWTVNHYADSLIFASRYTMAEYINKTRLDTSLMHIIPEGVSVNPEGKRLYNTTDTINIGIIGSYEPRKGHKVLFDAIDLLNKDKGLPDFRVHCYGQSRYGEYEKLVEYARQLGIYELISWHEYERNFDELYGHLDIVVQASVDEESMPLVPIDAAAYYKPVIASKLQGLMEIIEHNVTGFFFDIGDSHQLSYYLKELILKPKKRQDMGVPARQRYEEYFTASKMSQTYYKAFVK